MKILVDSKILFMGQRIFIEVSIPEQGNVPDQIQYRVKKFLDFMDAVVPDKVEGPFTAPKDGGGV